MNKQLNMFDEENEIDLVEKGGLYSLTDLWRKSGLGDEKKPAQWLKTDTAKEFVNHISRSEYIHLDQIVEKIRGGDNQGTFAHWQIALAYAKYLSPELHARVNRVFKERLEEDKKLQLPDFTNPAEAARAWADQYEISQKALIQIEADKPKIEFHDQVETSIDSISVAEFANLLTKNGLKIGQNKLFKYFYEKNYLIDSSRPYQWSLDNGWFEIKKITYTDYNGDERSTHKVLITGKGQIYFTRKLKG